MKNKIFTILLFMFIVQFSFAQQISTVQEEEIKKYVALLETAKTQNNNNQTLKYLTQIGQIYYNANVADKALLYFKEALPISEILKNKNAMMSLNNFIGILLEETENYSEAEKYYQTSLSNAIATKHKESMVNAYLKLSLNQYYQKKYNEAIINLKETEILALELNSTPMLKKIYGRMAECYLEMGNSTEYARLFTLSSNLMSKEKEELEALANEEKANAEKKSLELQLQEVTMNKLKDSMGVIEIQNQKNKAEIELLENQKKIIELENQKKEAEVKEQNEKLKKNRLIFIFFLSGFLLMIIFIGIVLKFLNDKRKANAKLELMNQELNLKNLHILYKNNELEDKNKKIETQNAELQQRKKEIEYQRDLLEQKNLQITESINYASKIQRAILPSQKAILTSFTDAFIFYRPRDIVSGDFYWYNKQKDYKFVAAVDCTGHSVPGAFMSMIGNTLLNEIINEKKILDPAQILTKLHEGVVITLHSQESEDEKTDDGMDITLCRYEKSTNEVCIAAANHVIFKFDENESEIIQGDIFSIGHTAKDIKVNFNNYSFIATDKTSIYLFSDGFPDQFGGPKGRKFMTEQLFNLIKEIQDKEMAEQYDIIEDKFEKWRGSRRQIDDILIIGIKF